MMGPHCWWGTGISGPMGQLLGVVFWLLVMYGLFVLISSIAKRGAGSKEKDETALDILKKRYARGELDAEEFAVKKKDLEA